MVKDPDRLLSLAYAGPSLRPRLERAFALDEAMADVLRNVQEPMIAQIRLAWWRDQLGALAAGEAAAPEPLLLRIAEALGRSEIGALGELPTAWEHLLEDPLSPDAVAHFAGLRATALAAIVNSPALTTPLTFWASIDFSAHCSDPALADAVRTSARALLPDRLAPFPRSMRVLIGLSRDDLAHPDARAPGSPKRVWRAFRHALLTP